MRKENYNSQKLLQDFSNTDPRLIKRVNKVLSFISDEFSIDEEREMHVEIFELVLGESNFANVLKDKLFICTDSSYIASPKKGKFKNNTGLKPHPKKWKIKPEGIIEVAEYFNISKPSISLSIVERVSRKHHEELTTGNFKYNTIKHRDYHDTLTSGVKSNIRNEILSNYGYNIEYDIVSSGPTVLYNTYLAIDGKKLPTIEKYLDDVKGFRKQISIETNTHYESVKTLITALTYGAKLSSLKLNKKTGKVPAVFQIAETEEVLKAWLANKLLRNLGKELTKMFKSIKIHFGFKTPSEVSFYYASIEERIRDILIKYCFEHDIQKFVIHDAIVVKEKLNLSVIGDRIEQELGYAVKFTTKILGEE